MDIGLGFDIVAGGAASRARAGCAPKTLDQITPEIDALFAKYQADAHIPGMVYGVVKDGKLAYVKGVGVQDLTRSARSPPTAGSASRR